MLDTKPLTIKTTLPFTAHACLNRLLAAAVVNPQFRSLLLVDPSRAIESGFQGETFDLSTEETALLFSIRANTLTDLAQKLTNAFDEFAQPTLQIPASYTYKSGTG